MNETTRLLVTTDGSPRSHAILPHAAAFASAWGAELVVLQVFDPHEEVADSGERLRDEIAGLLSLAGIEATAAVAPLGRDEETPAVILRAAEELRAGMIAMSSRGHGALRHALIGSVAMKVLEGARLPVMVGGASLDLPPVVGDAYHVLLTSDGSPASAAVAHALNGIVTAPHFKLTLMRACDAHTEDGQAAAAQLREIASLFDGDLAVATHVAMIAPLGGVDTAIIEQARAIGANAIALSTHGYSARRHLLMGSTAALLLGRSPLPLILARAE